MRSMLQRATANELLAHAFLSPEQPKVEKPAKSSGAKGPSGVTGDSAERGRLRPLRQQVEVAPNVLPASARLRASNGPVSSFRTPSPLEEVAPQPALFTVPPSGRSLADAPLNTPYKVVGAPAKREDPAAAVSSQQSLRGSARPPSSSLRLQTPPDGTDRGQPLPRIRPSTAEKPPAAAQSQSMAARRADLKPAGATAPAASSGPGRYPLADEGSSVGSSASSRSGKSTVYMGSLQQAQPRPAAASSSAAAAAARPAAAATKEAGASRRGLAGKSTLEARKASDALGRQGRAVRPSAFVAARLVRPRSAC